MITVTQMNAHTPPMFPTRGEMFVLTDEATLEGDFNQFEPLDLVQYSDRWIKLEAPLGTLVKSNYDGSLFKLVPKDGKKWIPVK